MSGEESLLKVCESEVLAAGSTTMSSSHLCSEWLSTLTWVLQGSSWLLSPGGVVVERRSSDVTSLTCSVAAMKIDK